MPDLDFGQLDLYAGVTEDFPFSVYLFESDGVTPAELGVGDTIHCVLSSRSKDEPTGVLLTIDSDAPTANKSQVIITATGDANTGDPAEGYVRFAQADTKAIVADWSAATLSKLLVCELYYVDASDDNPASARKLFLRGSLHLHRSGASV